MGLPDSILTDLTEFWPFDEGAGTLAVGYRGAMDLALARSQCNGGGAIAAAAGWTTEAGGRTTYNGGGFVDVTALGLLPADGSSMTVAVRFWPGGGQIQGGDWPGINVFQFFGMGGNYTDDNSAYSGFRITDVELDDPAQAIYLEGVLGSPTISLSGWTYPKAASPYTPHLAVFTITRATDGMSFDDIAIRFFVDGTPKTGTITVPTGTADLTKLMLGSIHWSTSSTTQAALWERALTDLEIAALGDNLDGLFGSIDSGGLVDEDGNSAIHFAWPVPRLHAASVIATTGMQRHTRAVHERPLRRYQLRPLLATGAEITLLASVINASRGGLLSILWKHPEDDAAPTRYRLVNAVSAGLEIARARAGVSADLVLVLEEWEVQAVSGGSESDVFDDDGSTPDILDDDGSSTDIVEDDGA